MPGTQEHEPESDLEEIPIEEEPESSRTPSLEENRAGFMLLDF
jgi:hypothetical protein